MRKKYIVVILTLFLFTANRIYAQCGSGEDITPPTFTCPSNTSINLNI